MMLSSEVLWNKALTDNNIKGLIGCLRDLYAGGEGDTSERVVSFNCWLQRSAELAKKDLLILCFSQCKGLWMCLDEKSVALVHKLLLKLKSLLSLVHLIEKYSAGLHSEHVGSRTSYIWGCWKQDHHAIMQHILLGHLVQWWSITGLLPKYPEAHEMKKISQMWREMDQKHRRTCLELSYADDKYRWSSLIQGMVAHMDKQHGPIWVSEDCAYQTYPPPSLSALLKLVLLPNIDILSVQAIIMYFVLDVSNFLHCEDDLLQSFCHVFSIPFAFSQQICGFWLLDHGLVTDSMNALLSPRACPPTLSWHHCAVLRTLLRTGENRAALKYLLSITPAVKNIHDIKLCVDVLIHNKCIAKAWALIRGLQTEDIHLFEHFIHVCENHGIYSNILPSLVWLISS
ncbi:protein ELYS-like [Labeo rohita]|uniref:protein ELYS-like n=1 Tax=Labeo rohita TaxID=84645 RepID=UPI0021E21DB6|nr:protein ELYS-like [Labeo rohita]